MLKKSSIVWASKNGKGVDSMDNVKVAAELVKMAKSLTARKHRGLDDIEKGLDSMLDSADELSDVAADSGDENLQNLYLGVVELLETCMDGINVIKRRYGPFGR